MRRFIVCALLPPLLIVLPLAGGFLMAAAVPLQAREFYMTTFEASYLDWVIVGLGAFLLLCQTFLAWRALTWKDRAFDTRPDAMLSYMSSASEWFPLLGLFGTVASVLQTFNHVGSLGGKATQAEIILLFAPALTTTASGLLMAFLNILPLWLVLVGRRMIATLAAVPAKAA
jgi:hypothetical protein